MEQNTPRTFRSYFVAFLTPQRTLILSFLSFIFLGTLALKLPSCTKQGGMDLLNALFTSTSAVCVTGLTVVETGKFFTPWGQVVILSLIQVGGLGIMTFSVLFYHLLGRGIPLRNKMAVQDVFAYAPVRDIFYIVKWVFMYTITIETVGACFLFWSWLPTYSCTEALYLAIFHAVSAFCNAGFSLLKGSLSSYRHNLMVNITFISLIILGGIGFVVLHELRRGLRRRSPLSLHTKVVLVTTAVLIVVGTLLFFLLERGNTLAGYSLKNKVIISLFQSVTARTAGFSTVEFWHLSNATLFVFVILMFVGASPGSCGGGVKTTNLAILFSVAWNRFRGRAEVNMFKRTLPRETVSRSISIFLASFLLVTLILVLVLIFQGGGIPHPKSRRLFLELLFEVTSAFGTVGLSTGATGTLTPLSKMLIIITMFVGRLGPLTLAFALAKREEARRFQYTEENIMVG
ncbi:MAG: ATPase [Deltaproteobacteria bacterium]|nr:MAG: ATPase [Deltaproteobacteria bacterium]